MNPECKSSDSSCRDSIELPSFSKSYRCVIVVELLADPVLVKDPIQLRTPDGQVRDTYIAAFEHVKYSLLGPPPDKDVVGLRLLRELTKQDVPPGIEVWTSK